MTTPRVAGTALALALAAAAPAAAQVEIVPLGDEQAVPQLLGWTQEWAKVAVDAERSRFAVVYETVVGHEVNVRFFDFDGVPTSPEMQVNTNLTGHIQDEPMAAMDSDGNLLVCWSDRNGYDGWQMGCFGQLFDRLDNHWGSEFQVNLNGASASQWEPHPVALPGGGWVVAFNGDNDGNAYLRYFDPDGTPRTGDIDINTYTNNGQTEAECAVSPSGVVLAVYADFGANVQGGTGTNLLARRFTSTGAVLDPLEFVVNWDTLPFDQLEPRIDCDGRGVFVMVWEDWGNDGDGAGVWARRYDEEGVALETEWRVNPVAVGDQRLPEVACADDGRFMVVWEDNSSPDSQIVARLYDKDAQPLAPFFIVSGDRAGDYQRPAVALDPAGRRAFFSYHGPGDSSADAYLRIFSIGDGPPIDDGRRVEGAGRRAAARPGPAGGPAGAPPGPPPPPLP